MTLVLVLLLGIALGLPLGVALGRRRLNRGRSGSGTRALTVEIVADTADFERSMRRATRSLDELRRRLR